MSILDNIYAKAKKNPQKIIFPESKNEKMMQAAYEAGTEGYIVPVLLGDPAELKALAAERGLNPDAFQYVDHSDEEYKQDVIARYLQLPVCQLSEKACNRKSKDPLNYAMLIQAVGDAAVTFAGIEYSTGDVLLAGQTIVGLKEGIATISSIGICDIPGYEGSEGSILAIGDSAVCTNPNAEELASIAISACETVATLLDWEPRCALLSYSSDGSGGGELVEKVVEAVKIAQEKRPDLAIDGEFQLDTAIVPATAAKKVKRESKVAGRANVLIWPDLNAGNIGVKLIQQFGHADAYGPMLQGFNKIVCDCSRGAPVSELKGNIVISAVRAM
ncbi:MAG: phosphate acetyltransferase [Parasporobacterium sp.]|nr:phosphate acetyltransferase [Parasporobacterium sp.]